MAAVLSGLRQGLSAVGPALRGSLEELAATIKTSASPLKDSITSVATDFAAASAPLRTGVVQLAGDFQTTTNTLREGASTMSKQLATLQAELSRIVTDLNATSAALAESLKDASDGTAGYRVEMDKVTQRLRETDSLLKGLEELILSVRRFISPDAPSASPRSQPPGTA